MAYFEYGEKEMDYLKTKDKTLGKAIDLIGPIKRKINPDLFSALIDSILSQQISSKAAITVGNRIIEKLSAITPENIVGIDPEDLQSCGLSMRKVSYMRELSSHVIEKKLVLDELHEMPDDEVCQRLIEIKGIGVWTAEMLMIFSMQRADILSFGDMAILRGLRMLYRHKKITRELFEKYRHRYSPYCSVASLYLWAISSGEYRDFTDPAPPSKVKENKKN